MAFRETKRYRSWGNDKYNSSEYNKDRPQQRVSQNNNNDQSNPRNLVEIEANECSVIALVDTGAQVSCVSQDFLT